jgi:hypothetical protein
MPYESLDIFCQYGLETVIPAFIQKRIEKKPGIKIRIGLSRNRGEESAHHGAGDMSRIYGQLHSSAYLLRNS